MAKRTGTERLLHCGWTEGSCKLDEGDECAFCIERTSRMESDAILSRERGQWVELFGLTAWAETQLMGLNIAHGWTGHDEALVARAKELRESLGLTKEVVDEQKERADRLVNEARARAAMDAEESDGA